MFKFLLYHALRAILLRKNFSLKSLMLTRVIKCAQKENRAALKKHVKTPKKCFKQFTDVFIYIISTGYKPVIPNTLINSFKTNDYHSNVFACFLYMYGSFVFLTKQGDCFLHHFCVHMRTFYVQQTYAKFFARMQSVV